MWWWDCLSVGWMSPYTRKTSGSFWGDPGMDSVTREGSRMAWSVQLPKIH